MEIQLTLFLPRDVSSVPLTRQVLDGCLRTLGVAQETRDDIALALSEACANVVQHAGPGDEYEVEVSVRNRRCAIEVVNTGTSDGEDQVNAFSVPSGPVSPNAERGRGLKIIDAVTDSLTLTANEREGRVVHFEKNLEWVPEAPGEQLFSASES